MEFDPEADPVDKKTSIKYNYIGFALLLSLFTFIIGNRWSNIVDSFRDDTESVAVETTDGLPADLDYSSVEEVFDLLKQRYDGDLVEEDLLDGIKEGLASASGDNYTVYLNAKDAKSFRDDLNGTFTGIGAEIGIEQEQIIVVAPLAGFPAEKAGLRAQDKIVQIDDESTFGMTVEQAVTLIRGEEGTDVKLTIVRSDQQLEITITRAEIVVPSVTYEIKDGIGYIQLSRFSEDTRTLMLEAANEMLDKKVKGIILDVRNNSGGFLNASVDVLSLWLDNKLVVEQRQGGEVTQSLSTSRGAILDGVPTVLLINEGSASASEIVAGAMQDYGVATLVGKQTFGKGSVQSLEELSDGGVLKVTIARWFTPNGNNIDESGISPDREVEITEEDFTNERDPQRDRAEKILNN